MSETGGAVLRAKPKRIMHIDDHQCLRPTHRERERERDRETERQRERERERERESERARG